jgi:hypothetical protein
MRWQGEMENGLTRGFSCPVLLAQLEKSRARDDGDLIAAGEGVLDDLEDEKEQAVESGANDTLFEDNDGLAWARSLKFCGAIVAILIFGRAPSLCW